MAAFAGDNVKALRNVTEGYDVKLKKETAEAWYFVCTKSKDNTNKDDPKKMDLVVSKATYLPISTTVKEKGVTVTMRDYAIALTFGTSALIDHNKKQKEKRQIVMMVMYDMYSSLTSIEKADSSIRQSMEIQRQLAEDPIYNYVGLNESFSTIKGILAFDYSEYASQAAVS